MNISDNWEMKWMKKAVIFFQQLQNEIKEEELKQV